MGDFQAYTMLYASVVDRLVLNIIHQIWHNFLGQLVQYSNYALHWICA